MSKRPSQVFDADAVRALVASDPEHFRAGGSSPKGGMTLEEVARAMGLTRERVRQIEANAIRKLRYELAQRGLSLEDLL